MVAAPAKSEANTPVRLESNSCRNEATPVDVSSRQHTDNLSSLWDGKFLGKEGCKPGCS